MVRKERLKLLEAGIIYPVGDSQWVSHVHCVPKKGGITVVPNDKDELIPQRIVTCYRMVIDFCKLNKATKKDHYPLPFIDQMLEILSKYTHFCFLDGYSAFSQIHVSKEDQCHFMVNEGIVLGHKISERGIEVDKAKVDAI